MKRIVALLLTLMLLPGASLASYWEYNEYWRDQTWPYAPLCTTLTMRLATRSGPTTKYTEPGTFLSAGDTVYIISRVYDEMNEIWWVQVDFQDERGCRYRGYTGAQRIRANVSYIPIEPTVDELGSTAWAMASYGPVDCYYGPGPEYVQYPRPLPEGTQGTIIMVEGNWGLLEVYGASPAQRVWVNMYDMQY